MITKNKNTNRLLVIDDEAAFGNFVGKIGALAGFDIAVTDNIDEFRRRLHDMNPTVMALDLNMPGVDGIELIRELGEQKCKAKIVLTSGMDARVLETVRRLGSEIGLDMAATFQKPIRAAELRSLLESLKIDAPLVTAEALRAAIRHDALFLLFQPQTDIRTRRLVGVESLVRWRADDGSVLNPDSFIPLAEAEGVIDELSEWVARHAIIQGAAWQAQGHPLQVSINLSALNIHSHQLPDILADQCREAGLSPEYLTLELTETASMQDVILMLEVAGRFRLKGFKLSLDDFGTGYSSLVQLVRLPFSEIKIDKSFVMEMDRVKDSAIVAKIIVTLAENLGLTSVAEGVETEEILSMLAAIGCDVAQGFYFAKPLPPEEITRMLAERSLQGG